MVHHIIWGKSVEIFRKSAKKLETLFQILNYPTIDKIKLN